MWLYFGQLAISEPRKSDQRCAICLNIHGIRKRAGTQAVRPRIPFVAEYSPKLFMRDQHIHRGLLAVKQIILQFSRLFTPDLYVINIVPAKRDRRFFTHDHRRFEFLLRNVLNIGDYVLFAFNYEYFSVAEFGAFPGVMICIY